jgi:hypothetical protein
MGLLAGLIFTAEFDVALVIAHTSLEDWFSVTPIGGELTGYVALSPVLGFMCVTVFAEFAIHQVPSVESTAIPFIPTPTPTPAVPL